MRNVCNDLTIDANQTVDQTGVLVLGQHREFFFAVSLASAASVPRKFDAKQTRLSRFKDFVFREALLIVLAWSRSSERQIFCSRMEWKHGKQGLGAKNVIPGAGEPENHSYALALTPSLAPGLAYENICGQRQNPVGTLFVGRSK